MTKCFNENIEQGRTVQCSISTCVLQEAAKVREEGRKSLEVAQRMQVEISQEASELESRTLLLQEKERQIADVSLPGHP